VIVVISHRVFATASPLALISVFRLCFDERHVLLTNPIYIPGSTPAIDTWIAGLPARLQHEVSDVLEQGPILATQRTNRAARIVIDDVPESRFDRVIPVLSMSDALEVLHAPLKLLVENGRHDGAFLLRIVPPLWKDELGNAIRRRWIEIDNGGGIGELTARVREAARNPRTWMRLWVMFDSDARQPSLPSDQSKSAADACTQQAIPWPLPFHQLDRRTIENYLPIKCLFAWAELATGLAKTKLRRAAAAFQRLRDEQRHHYNMKRGFLGDTIRQRRLWYAEHNATIVETMDLAPIYANVQEDDRRALHGGFGDDVAMIFHDPVPEEWLRREVPSDFREALFQSLFDRI